MAGGTPKCLSEGSACLAIARGNHLPAAAMEILGVRGSSHGPLCCSQ